MKNRSGAKKLTTAVLAGTMLFTQSAFMSGASVKADAASSNGIYFHDTFEDSSGNWEARGDGEILLSGRHPFKGTNALLIKDRQGSHEGMAGHTDGARPIYFPSRTELQLQRFCRL